MMPSDFGDMLVTLDAEDSFDVAAELPRISAPTLVIGGGKDAFYPAEMFRETAAGVQDGRAHVFDRWGHLRASSSTASTRLALGFMLAGLDQRDARP